MCDLETSRIGAPYIYIYIYDISSLRVPVGASRLRVNSNSPTLPTLTEELQGETETVVYVHFILYPVYGFHALTQLVEALRYKPKGRGFDSRLCHWNFSLT